MRKSLKSPNNVAEKVSLKPTLDIYGISSRHFDTSFKFLLFVTKFNRAKLIVFAFSDYNFAEKSNNLSPDFQDSAFRMYASRLASLFSSRKHLLVCLCTFSRILLGEVRQKTFNILQRDFSQVACLKDLIKKYSYASSSTLQHRQ